VEHRSKLTKNLELIKYVKYGLNQIVFPLTIFTITALLWCYPAFSHGFTFGTFDTALRAGIGKSLASVVHNIVAGDQARQGAPWANINYQAIHSGKLPLWNPYSDLGLPELANFQSAPFDLPSLISYLFPVNLAYTAIVITRIIVTGMGCYVLTRTMGVSFYLSILAGIAAELAGPTAGWAGWPQTNVSEWFCWFLACIILILRKPTLKHALYTVVVIAFLIAGGFPEVIALTAIAIMVFFVVMAIYQIPQLLHNRTNSPVASYSALEEDKSPLFSRWQKLSLLLSENRYYVTSVIFIAISLVLAMMLSAPTWIPALKTLSISVSAVRSVQPTLPMSDLLGFLDPMWFGLPNSAQSWFGPINYYEMAAFVGPLILIGALSAIKKIFQDQYRMAIVLASIVLFFLIFGIAPIHSIAVTLPVIKTIAFGRGLLLLCPLLITLAAIGLEDMRTHSAQNSYRIITIAVSCLWLGMLISTYLNNSLTNSEKSLRLEGMYISLLPLLAGIFYILVIPEKTRFKIVNRNKKVLYGFSIIFMLLAEGSAVILASAQINTWSASYLPQNSAISTLIGDTKGALIGLGGNHAPMQAPGLGIFPELNAAYGIREFAGYDATTPRALDREWTKVSTAPGLAQFELTSDQTNFAPNIENLAQAKAFDVTYVLEPLHPPLRLITDASTKLRTILRTELQTLSPNAKNQLIEGIIDDIEWKLQQPLLARAFPADNSYFMYNYLKAVALGLNINPQVPMAFGIQEAQKLTALIQDNTAAQSALVKLVTRRPPKGFKFIAIIGAEKLYEIPGSNGALLPDKKDTIMRSLTYLTTDTASIIIKMTHAGWTTLEIDGEPGWTATSDRKTLPLRYFDNQEGGYLAVKLPKGISRVYLSYWPQYLTQSIVAFFLAITLILCIILTRIKRKIPLRRRKSTTNDTHSGNPS
jgi:hypothetical protein